MRNLLFRSNSFEFREFRSRELKLEFSPFVAFDCLKIIPGTWIVSHAHAQITDDVVESSTSLVVHLCGDKSDSLMISLVALAEIDSVDVVT